MLQFNAKTAKELAKKITSLETAFDWNCEFIVKGFVKAGQIKDHKTEKWDNEETYFDSARIWGASGKGFHVEYYIWGYRKQGFCKTLGDLNVFVKLKND